MSNEQKGPMAGPADPEEDGLGLLLVDLLRLKRTFSWRRYRIDLAGFLLACAFVAGLMAILIWISRLLQG